MNRVRGASTCARPRPTMKTVAVKWESGDAVKAAAETDEPAAEIDWKDGKAALRRTRNAY